MNFIGSVLVVSIEVDQIWELLRTSDIAGVRTMLYVYVYASEKAWG